MPIQKIRTTFTHLEINWADSISFNTNLRKMGNEYVIQFS